MTPVLSSESACPACGSSSSETDLRASDYITGATFDVRRCTACGTGFTFPMPTHGDEFYPERYRDYVAPIQWVLKRVYGFRVWSWHRSLRGPGRVLEVGSGKGWMLRAFRDRGWKVVGLERSIAGTISARNRYRLPVVVGDLAALRPGAGFDLVILFHVLEHLPNPLPVLTDCAALLKPGGRLVVAVHNYASWQSRMFGAHWFHLDAPRHLVHFTPSSLTAALERSGLEVEHCHFVSAHDQYGWLQSALNKLGFRQNHLTDLLMGGKRTPGDVIRGAVMLAIGAVLFLPFGVLTLISWPARRGALMEIQARRAS